MNFFAIIVSVVIAIVVGYHIIKLYTAITLYRIEYKIDDLALYFSIYLSRKIILIEKKLSYEDTFKYEFRNENVVVNTELTQKELISDLYKDIAKIEKLMTKVPADFLEEDEFIDSISTFYEVKREIRTEKLLYEGTTF